jgi:hypothetical protein
MNKYYYFFLFVFIFNSCTVNDTEKIIETYKVIELDSEIIDSIFIRKETKNQECIFSIINRTDTIVSISNLKYESKYSCPNLNIGYFLDSVNRNIYYNLFENKLIKLSLDDKRAVTEFDLKEFNFNTGSKKGHPIITKNKKNIILSGGGDIFIFSEKLILTYSFRKSLNRDSNLNKEPKTIHVENNMPELEFKKDMLIIKAKVWNYYNIADKNGPYIFSDTLLLKDNVYSYTPSILQ